MYKRFLRTTRPTERFEIFFSWIWLWMGTLSGTIFLIILWTGLFWLLGFVWENGWMIAKNASYVGLGIAVLGYIFSEPLVVLATNAKRLPKDHKYVTMVNVLAKKAHMRRPRVYLIPDYASNAFATGVYLPIPLIGGRGAIGLTQGIVELMDEDELRGVIGHELTHLKSGDLILATMASSLIIALSLVLRIILRSPRALGRIQMGNRGTSTTRSSRSSKSKGSGAGCGGAALLALLKALWALLVVFLIIILIFAITQFVMPIIRSWINRQREYWADAGSAKIVGSPDPLIRALAKLNRSSTQVSGVGHFAGAFFNVPAFEQNDILDRLFSTHPSTDDRITMLNRRADGEFNLL